MSGRELKTCPLCGGIVSIDRSHGDLGTITCQNGSVCMGSGLSFVFMLRDEETALAAWNTRTPDPAQIRADALRAAGQEYILEHVMETDWHRQGRHSAIRGMMARMGLYAELEAAIDEALALIAAPLSPTAVDGSPAPDAGSKEDK